MKDNQLNGLGAYDDVDFFGLDSYGMPAGINPMWGAVAGTGLGTLTAVGIKQFTSWDKWAELLGLGAAGLTGGVMAIFPPTRHAGWNAMAAGLLNNGVRAAHELLSAKEAVKAAVGENITESGATDKQVKDATGGKTEGIRAVAAGALNGIRALPAANLRGANLPNVSPTHWGTTSVARAA